MENSLQTTIYEAVKQASPRTLTIDEVFGIADKLGHKQSLAERKCRVLVHAGLIVAIRNEKKYITGYELAKNYSIVARTDYGIPPYRSVEEIVNIFEPIKEVKKPEQEPLFKFNRTFY